MTQLEAARKGLITGEMRRVAQRECARPEFIRDEVARGRLVIPANKRHLAGSAGAAPVTSGTAEEVEKLEWAQKYGADTLMDLSTGGDLAACRQAIIDHATIPIGTVPIYSMIVGRAIEDLSYDVILKEIERQAEQGVDYFTIHAGVLYEHLPLVGPRVTGIVSRGGSLLAKWMIQHGRQNPMYELFDEISAIMREYDVTYSLGDGLRPGCLADASDAAQLAAPRTLAELVQRARAAGAPAGSIAYKIAAHAGDVARGIAGARAWDDDLSRARAALNWPRQFELAFDGETARALHDEDLEVDTDFCAMCGHDWCSMRIS